MRGAPHSGFATLISRISWQTSPGVLGRPPRGEDFHRVQHLRSQVIERRKHQAIDIADGDSLGRSTPQYIELMAKDENFGLQGCGYD
jgi:hypothetical protein